MVIDMTILKSLAEINVSEPNSRVSFIALVVDIKLQTTKNLKEYARLYIRDDNNVTQTVPFWDSTLESVKQNYKIDSVYEFVVTLKDYQGKCVIDKINSAEEVTDNAVIQRFKSFLFLHPTEFNSSIILAAVKQLKGTIFEPYLEKIYGDGTVAHPAFQRLMHAFASINHHDNYPGGLINHIGGMLYLASFLQKNYLMGRCESIWNIDWLYVTVGILVHDIGKLETYDNITDYTVRFKDDCTLNHNILGVSIFYSIHNSLPVEKQMPYNTLMRLLYTIQNHDNIDRLYTHKYIEDKIISYIDGLDSSLAVACKLST